MVYILHFERSFHHARHYVGYAEDVMKRFRRHMKGDGARLVRAVKEAGIEIQIARVIEGDRSVERKIKNQKNTARLCPHCNPNIKE